MNRACQIRNRISLEAVVFCVLLALSLFTSPARAAVGGRIAGTVTDGSGAVVGDAEIVALNVATGVTQNTRTDSKGFYSFQDLPVGIYDLSVSKTGFREYKKLKITLEVNASISADVALEVGKETQQVEVNAGAVQVDTTSTQLGEVITGEKITAVPLNGRSYLNLLALQPGVAPTSTGLYNEPGNISVNGGRESSNGFMLNGGTVEGGNQGSANIVPNLDSIAEFRIITNNFDAEYGQYSGSQVNVITKSGANAYHGDVFEFLRNTVLDARNFYENSRGKYNQNQFGATFGGPILRNKLFFFVDYQGTRQVIGQNTPQIPVPSSANRSGDVASLSKQLTGTVSGPYWAGLLQQKLGYAVQAGEPYYSAACTSTSACVFPNAIVPVAAFDTISSNLLKYIPLANSGSFYSTSSDNLVNNDNMGAGRIDWTLGTHAISGYYYQNGAAGINPYVFSSFPGFEGTTATGSKMINMGDTKTFGSAKLNELRLIYLQYVNVQGVVPEKGVTLASLGFPTTPDGLQAQNKALEGVPSIALNGYNFGLPEGGQRQVNNTYEVLDNFSLVKGTHAFKFGGVTNYAQITQHPDIFNNGQFNFSGQETGSDFTDFLLGAPSFFLQGVQAPLHSRARYYSLYAEDSWRATTDLTINYGLRWEVPMPWYEAQGELETLVPGLQSKVFPGAPTGWVFPGDPGIPKTLAPTRYNNLAPRLGLAYTPSAKTGLLGRLLGAKGDTSIRAAAGIFYTSFENISDQNEVGDAPYGFFWVSPAPPLFGTPFIDRASGHNEGQRFPVNIPKPPSQSNPNDSINWAQFLPISSSPGFWYKNQVPYAENYSLSIQRQLGPNSLFQAAYVGTQGHRLVSNLESNPGDPGLCLSVSQMSQVQAGSPLCGPFGENGVYTRTDGTVINSTRGPFGPNFGSNGYYITIGNSNYNSLQLTWKYRTGPLEFLAGYTWAKSLDNSSAWLDMINPVNHAASYALSAFNVPQNFVVSYRYVLPFADYFGQHRITSGWVLSGISRFASGQPVTMTEQDDNSLLGTLNSGNGSGSDVPNYDGSALHVGANPRACVKNPTTCSPYFNTAAFTPEQVGFVGNSSHRFITGPGINNFDMALLKDTHITESKSLELRFEFFNLFNHAQFLTPSGNITNSGAFGIVTGAGDPRIAQVAGKFVF